MMRQMFGSISDPINDSLSLTNYFNQTITCLSFFYSPSTTIMQPSISPYLVMTIESRYDDLGDTFLPLTDDNGTVFIIDRREYTVTAIDSVRGVTRKKFSIMETVSGRCVTPDGKSFIILTLDHRMAVYDIDSCVYGERQPTRFIEGTFNAIGIIHASSDGKKIFAQFDGDQFRIYDFDSGKLCATTENGSDTQRLYYLTSSLNSKSAAMLLVNSVGIFDIATGKKFLTRNFRFGVLDMKPTPKDDEFTLITNDGSMSIWDTKNDTLMLTKKITKDRSVENVAHFGITKTAHIVDGFLTLLDMRRSKDVHVTFDYCGSYYPTLKFIRGGEYLLVIRDFSVQIYSTDSHPFWNIGNHLEFNGETGAAIRLVFMANRISSRKGKTLSLFSNIPREIMCHIFSFIARPY